MNDSVERYQRWKEQEWVIQAMIAKHDMMCVGYPGCGDDAMTYPKLTEQEKAIVDHLREHFG